MVCWGCISYRPEKLFFRTPDRLIYPESSKLLANVVWWLSQHGCCASQADERTNYTAIWVFTPELVDDPESYFKVYKMFEMVPNLCNDEGKCPKDDNPLYGIEPAQGPYNTLAT